MASTVGPDEFRELCSAMSVAFSIKEVDGSSLFCLIHKALAGKFLAHFAFEDSVWNGSIPIIMVAADFLESATGSKAAEHSIHNLKERFKAGPDEDNLVSWCRGAYPMV